MTIPYTYQVIRRVQTLLAMTGVCRQKIIFIDAGTGNCKLFNSDRPIISLPAKNLCGPFSET